MARNALFTCVIYTEDTLPGIGMIVDFGYIMLKIVLHVACGVWTQAPSPEFGKIVDFLYVKLDAFCISCCVKD